MKTGVMFSKATDEWETPQDFYDALDVEFNFDMDAAARSENAKTSPYLSHVDDALAVDWVGYCRSRYTDVPFPTVWLNPPYSRCREFIAKAAQEAQSGCTVVCLVPSRTDTRWWHEHVWDSEQHRARPGVEIRFVKGRLKFVGATAGAPFPSVVLIFRPTETATL